MKFGILFAGQGAQQAGMGLDFLSDPLFKETIDQASQACGLDLPEIWKNDRGQLDETRYVQPALVAFEYGIWQMLVRDTDLPGCGLAGLLRRIRGSFSQRLFNLASRPGPGRRPG